MTEKELNLYENAFRNSIVGFIFIRYIRGISCKDNQIILPNPDRAVEFFSVFQASNYQYPYCELRLAQNESSYRFPIITVSEFKSILDKIFLTTAEEIRRTIPNLFNQKNVRVSNTIQIFDDHFDSPSRILWYLMRESVLQYIYLHPSSNEKTLDCIKRYDVSKMYSEILKISHPNNYAPVLLNQEILYYSDYDSIVEPILFVTKTTFDRHIEEFTFGPNIDASIIQVKR